MADHHAAHLARESPKNGQFGFFKFFPGTFDSRQIMVRIEPRSCIAREMLSTGLDPGLQKRIVEGPGKSHHLLD